MWKNLKCCQNVSVSISVSVYVCITSKKYYNIQNIKILYKIEEENKNINKSITMDILIKKDVYVVNYSEVTQISYKLKIDAWYVKLCRSAEEICLSKFSMFTSYWKWRINFKKKERKLKREIYHWGLLKKVYNPKEERKEKMIITKN